MTTIQIINPKAGHGYATDVSLKKSDIIKYTTQGIGDAERYVDEFCRENDGELHFIACGGDGTINEVVNGIMKAGAGDRAKFSVAPTGSGNDFVRNFKPDNKQYRIDLIKYNSRYSVNMINIGFDCSVVVKTQLYKNKKLISGSMAYVLGIGNVLFNKLGQNFKITIVDEYDNTHEIEKECLLTAIANGSFCGGGFKALPLASLDDGLLDMLIVSKISRAKFVTLVGAYKKGTYIDPTTKEIDHRFKDVLDYYRCKKVTVTNISEICADGEVEETEAIEIEVIPDAITYIG